MVLCLSAILKDSIALRIILYKTANASYTPLKLRLSIPSARFKNSESSNLRETYTSRCFCRRRSLNDDFWRIGSGISSTKLSDVNIGDRTVEDGCNCLSASTTNRLLSYRVKTVIDNVNRRNVIKTNTTIQNFNIDNTTSSIYNNIKYLCLVVLNNTNSWGICLVITSTRIVDVYRNNLTCSININSDISRNRIFASGFIDINFRCYQIPLSRIINLDCAGNQSTSGINVRLSQCGTTRDLESNSRSKGVSRTRTGQCKRVYDAFFVYCSYSSRSSASRVCRRFNGYDRRIERTIPSTTLKQLYTLDTINQSTSNSAFATAFYDSYLGRILKFVVSTTRLDFNATDAAIFTDLSNTCSTTTITENRCFNRPDIDSRTKCRRYFENYFVIVDIIINFRCQQNAVLNDNRIFCQDRCV